jgi:hypothetical protein
MASESSPQKAMTLKLQIPSTVPPASIVSGEPSPSPYNDVTPFPSPLAGSSDSGLMLLKSYNGQSSPVGAISRASSLRWPSTPSSPVAGSLELPKSRSISDLQAFSHRAHVRSASTELRPPYNRTSSNELVDKLHREKSEPPIAEELQAKVYDAYDKEQRRSSWREIKLLGRGAFSRVVLAKPVSRLVTSNYKHCCDDILVAIKIVDLGVGGGSSRERIKSSLAREIDILKEISHPSLIRLYGFNMDKTRALMVLPHCRGGDLFDMASKYRPKLRPSLVRRIFAEVVNAVAYLHLHNIVHRDIKLENVLLNLSVPQLLSLENPFSYSKSISTLTDLGLSRKIDPDNPILTTRCGSEDYVPPEIVMGQPYDGRETDSWALGVLLYAVMEGRLPFDPPANAGGGRSRGRTAHRIARIEWSWNNFDKDDYHPEWEGGKQIVACCLQRRDTRLLASDIAKNPWVRDAVCELQPDSVLPIDEMFDTHPTDDESL